MEDTIYRAQESLIADLDSTIAHLKKQNEVFAEMNI